MSLVRATQIIGLVAMLLAISFAVAQAQPPALRRATPFRPDTGATLFPPPTAKTAEVRQANLLEPTQPLDSAVQRSFFESPHEPGEYVPGAVEQIQFNSQRRGYEPSQAPSPPLLSGPLVEPVLLGFQDPVEENGMQTQDVIAASGLDTEFRSDTGSSGVGQDFYSPRDFEGGLIIATPDLAMKLSGYVKADLIYDFDAIDSTDLFDVTTIPPDADPRRNARFHARQTRLNMDARWKTRGRPTKIFVEGDFFSEGDRFRLRHAYGEVGPFLAGQTWTTFKSVASSPATLDFEGSVSSVNRRQAQVRYTAQLWTKSWTSSVSLENPRSIISLPPGADGELRNTTPDLIARVRYQRDWGEVMLAIVARELAFQEPGMLLQSGTSIGSNFAGAIILNDSNKVYYQIAYGEGIGSYRGLPDAAPTSATTGKTLEFLGWMVGFTHDWSEDLSSNYTFGKNVIETTAFQDPDAVAGTTYSAANLIWQPTDRIATGIEYLYGVRKSNDRRLFDASRLQISFIFYLP